MQPKKSPATAESTSADTESVDADPQPGRLPTVFPAGSSDMRRRSQSSLRSESRARVSISCVSRESVSGEDCARQRFIVWAAVKRNRSVRMAASERLQCPLLRCGERFNGHEEMLRHLSLCKHLSTGEYVCYECMKVERFNDKKCRCCLGQPTKRRRIINMAKHFFSNIGNTKVRRENFNVSTQDTHLYPPPSYDSLVDMHEQYDPAQLDTPALQENRNGRSEPLEPQLELNGTELLELDSTPLLPTAQLDAVNYDSHSTGMRTALDSCDVARGTPLYPPPNITTTRHEPRGYEAILPMDTAPSVSGGRRPSLALDTQIDRYRTKTRTAYLSPSSSLRSSSHGISPVTPWSTSSASSAAWSAAPGADTGMASPITPMSTTAHSMASQADRLLGIEKDVDMFTCPEDPCHYAPGDLPELPGNDQPPFAMPRLLSDPLLFSYNPKDNYSWMSSVDTEISLGTSVNMMFTDPNMKSNLPSDFLEPQVSSSATKALVESVWDTLFAHFTTSVSKLSRIQGNPLAVALREQTPKAVALAGLAGFKKVINHTYSTEPDPVEYLCFIHVMYSISLVIHEDDFITRSRKFYEQALAYGTRLDPVYHTNYCQVVATIWQPGPQDSLPPGRTRGSSNRPAGNKGKEPDYHSNPMATVNSDPLLITGQYFLDELENLAVNTDSRRPIEVLTSELWSSHSSEDQPGLQGNTPLAIASTYMVQDLSRRFPDSENWLRKLKVIGQKAQAGCYPTIRKLELELIQAGKDALDLADFFDRYILQIRDLCNQIYNQQGTQPRARYHLLGISLVESLIRSIAREPQQHQQGSSEYPLNISYPYEDEFLQGLDKTFPYFLPLNPPHPHPPVSSGGTADYGPTLDPTTLLPGTPSTQLPTIASNHLPLVSDASETPSDSYTVSPAPLSDTPLEIPSTSSSRPTVPNQLQAEGSEKPGPSTLTSSGQKVEANERCEICGYRPKGDPQWFKGSMAKHKKMQHSTNPPVIFKCPFPGCNSEYKNRRDNLRQHQIEKNHFVGDEASRRPQKRKKVSRD
ncbi:hypothetical protein F5Y19DRAFT_462443 [Xylariaceae sp. FL1651]|nr:hypothetical protein F5Y19DRAFT_462443 [Xylariaceae sp. FL1651]